MLTSLFLHIFCLVGNIGPEFKTDDKIIQFFVNRHEWLRFAVKIAVFIDRVETENFYQQLNVSCFYLLK